MESVSLKGVCSLLDNLLCLAEKAAGTEDRARKLSPASERLRTSRAEAELAAAQLELAVKQFRAEWRGISLSVEELLASLEAAPLLACCPE